MKTIDVWLQEYSESHQDPINKVIHYFAVPLILFSTLGLLWSIGSPFSHLNRFLNWTLPVVLLVTFFYFRLSMRLAIGMFAVFVLQLLALACIEPILRRPLWEVSFMVFATAWIFQFFGHKIEGERPSFLKDLQFLLIGPVWILATIYRKLGLRI